MAYTDTSHNPNRTATIATVALIHAGLGYALISGFAGAVIVEMGDSIKSKFIPEETVVPLPPPPPSPDAKEAVDDTKITPAETPWEDKANFKVAESDPPVVYPTAYETSVIKLPVDPPPRYTPVSPKPRGSMGDWVTPNDYPSRPLRMGVEGTTTFRLSIGTNGKVTDCAVTGTSGSADLDAAACKYLSRRARFEPARDGNNQPVAGEFTSRIVWQIPD